MNRRQSKSYAILLGVCFLAQTLIGTSQPFGLSAGTLIPVFLVSMIGQLILFRLLSRKAGEPTRFAAGAVLTVLFLSVGYDVVKAERFYRSVTASEFSFWWLAACMLLIGWYAARCARPAVLRAAQPVLILLLLSLLALGLTGSYRPENLSPVHWEDTVLMPALRIVLEQIFCPEVLLWLLWLTDPNADGGTAPEQCKAPFVPAAVIGLHTAVLVVFSVLGEMALGQRFAQLPQMFGTLSLLSSGADANHGGSLYHCVWLMALAVRVGAECELIGRLAARLMPRCQRKLRLLTEGSVLLLAVVLWETLWQQNCLLILSGCIWTSLLLCTSSWQNSRIKKRKEGT